MKQMKREDRKKLAWLISKLTDEEQQTLLKKLEARTGQIVPAKHTERAER